MQSRSTDRSQAIRSWEKYRDTILNYHLYNNNNNNQWANIAEYYGQSQADHA